VEEQVVDLQIMVEVEEQEVIELHSQAEQN